MQSSAFTKPYPLPALLEAYGGIISEVLAEHARALHKHGVQNRPAFEWHLIFSEEAGEVSKAACEAYFDNIEFSPEYRAELVQATGVGLAALLNYDQRFAAYGPKCAHPEDDGGCNICTRRADEQPVPNLVDALLRDKVNLIDETHRWSNALRDAEEELREANAKAAGYRRELGELYATIFGDGGQRQGALDRLPDRIHKDDLFGDSVAPHRVFESGAILQRLFGWAGPAIEGMRERSRQETQSYTGLTDCPTCKGSCIEVDGGGDVVDCSVCAGLGEVPAPHYHEVGQL